MWKNILFSIITSLFLAISSIFIGDFSVSAQENGFVFSQWTQTVENRICSGGDCGLKEGLEDVRSAIGNDIITDKNAVDYIQSIIIYALSFVSLIAVIYIIWGGFNLIVWNGDDEKLQSLKKTITHIAIGLIVMWLAYSIVAFIINILEKSKTGTPTRTSAAVWNFDFFPIAKAQSYSENEFETFADYKNRVQVAIEELETELRIEKKVSVANISKVKSLVQSAFDRLPDKNLEAARINESNKRAVDMYLEMAKKEPTSTQVVGEAISRVANFITTAKTDSIKGSISATPTTGNAPLTVSFSAQNVIDPSGTIPPAQNYIWWVRENGGVRRELGRGASLTQTFTNEGTYTINLDVISASRNSKGKVDILPLTTSTNIEVKPKIGEITLLVNGVNVSNLDTLKMSPIVANQGIIFDASASRAIGNGKILETKWDFGNGNSLTYKTAPTIERQIFATQGKFPVKLSFKTNDGQTFSKDITLIIVDPAASIKIDKTTANVGETLSFASESMLGDVRNVEYLWTVQDEQWNRDTKSGNGLSFSHTFQKIGTYIVTLTAKSPNGGIDTDSKTITIESRPPIASLDMPVAKNQEQPNTFYVDASRSYDPDTNSRTGLTYTWKLNGKPISLTGDNENASQGFLTLDSIGEYTISVQVANQFGKIATAEQKFRVQSVVAWNLIIMPQVVKVWQEASFIAQSKNAKFFTWNMGDGKVASGSDRSMSHSYKTTGTYNITLTLQGEDSNQTTTINRKIYVTDMDSPFAVIKFSNSSNSVTLEKGVCNGKDAYVLKRGEMTSVTGAESVNVDGNTSNLDYTWKYMWKTFTLPNFSEIFRDLGCFPVELTVRSKTNGATHTATEYIKLENQVPQLTNITTHVDANKKDSQKLIVKATANGVNDPDGIVTSYIWYYTTDSDKEPQSLQITQKPEMTFVLPNVSEKYYFGVIIEDNDGARVNSANLFQNQSPLIIDNENGNVHMPLITLNVPNKTIKAGQQVTFTASAKTIMGTDITNKSQYAWDLDGDGKIDEKTTTPTINHTYTKAGDYTVRVRVTNNGVSNTKFSTIQVRNELKAAVQGYKIPGNKVYLLNTSQGVYDHVKWTIGDFTSNQLESVLIDYEKIPQADDKGSIGTLLVASNNADTSTANIILRELETVEGSDSGLVYQSFPRAENDVITVKDPSQVVKISMYGNKATSYAIDSNLDLDGLGDNMDGISDNDIDNKNSPSYQDGSVFTISDFSQSTHRERKVKLTTYDGATPIHTKTITLILDFISETASNESAFSEIDSASLTEFEKDRLDKLASMIRELPDSERIIIMQKYNVLVENWGSNFEKAKNLVDIQRQINDLTGIEETKKESFWQVIEELLISDANTSNSVTTAIKLVRDLLPPNSANYQEMIAKVDAIASNPTNHAENKKIGTELLVLIQQEPRENLADDYKSIIRQQLLMITSGGDSNANAEQSNSTAGSSTGGWIMGLIISVIKILGIIILVLLAIVGIFYAIFSFKRKGGEGGFTDYVIDSIAHREKAPKEEKIIPAATTVATTTAVVEEKKDDLLANTENDPLKNYVPPTENTSVDPLATPSAEASAPSDAQMPDWLKPQNPSGTETSDPLLSPSTETTTQGIQSGLPDWLAPTGTTESSTETHTNETPVESNTENQGGLPDWLAPTGTTESTETITESIKKEEEIFANNSTATSTVETNDIISENTTSTDNMLPNWLDSNTPIAQSEPIDSLENSENNSENSLPVWLSQEANQLAETSTTKENIINSPSVPQVESNQTNSLDDNLPDWIKNTGNEPISEAKNSENVDIIPTNDSMENITSESNALPNWLVEASTQTAEASPISEEDNLYEKNSKFSYTSSKGISETNSIPMTSIDTDTDNEDIFSKEILNTTSIEADNTSELPESTSLNTETFISEEKPKKTMKKTKQIIVETTESETKSSPKKVAKNNKKDDVTQASDIPEWLK